MEGLGQKNGDREICLLRNAPSGCVSDFGKSPQKQASIARLAMTTAAWPHHAYFAEQLSLL
jgi:hypothetical protein